MILRHYRKLRQSARSLPCLDVETPLCQHGPDGQTCYHQCPVLCISVIKVWDPGEELSCRAPAMVFSSSMVRKILQLRAVQMWHVI